MPLCLVDLPTYSTSSPTYSHWMKGCTSRAILPPPSLHHGHEFFITVHLDISSNTQFRAIPTLVSLAPLGIPAELKGATVKTRSTLRNSRVRSYLTEEHWLHRMWCALVNSLVPDLRSRGAEIVWRMQDLAQRLISMWMEDKVVKMFRWSGGVS